MKNEEFSKCVRCGLTIPVNETDVHIKEFHKAEFQSWKKKFGFDKFCRICGNPISDVDATTCEECNYINE